MHQTRVICVRWRHMSFVRATIINIGYTPASQGETNSANHLFIC